MRTSTPQALAAASRIPFGPDCDLETHPRREAGPGAPGLSGAPRGFGRGGFLQAASSEHAGRGVGVSAQGFEGPSPGLTPRCVGTSHFLPVRGAVPEHPPEAGANSRSPAAGRIELIGSGACIVFFLACALFDAPHWIARALVAWGWV